MPDGAFHFDWLLAVDEPATCPLLTARVARHPAADPEAAPGGAGRAGEGAVGATQGAHGTDRLAFEPLPSHRVTYLIYEGPVRRGALGRVQRVGEGWWREIAAASDTVAGDGWPAAFEVVWSFVSRGAVGLQSPHHARVHHTVDRWRIVGPGLLERDE